jgi:hypothetical protein
MNKLGFDSLKEYQEYLEFKKMKQMGAWMLLFYY